MYNVCEFIISIINTLIKYTYFNYIRTFLNLKPVVEISDIFYLHIFLSKQ